MNEVEGRERERMSMAGVSKLRFQKKKITRIHNMHVQTSKMKILMPRNYHNMASKTNKINK